MRKINDTEPKEKSVSDSARNTFHTNRFNVLAGHLNGLSAFHNNENAEKSQCDLCRPTAYKSNNPIELCLPCQAIQEKRKSNLEKQLITPPKVLRLDRRCFSCNRGLTPARMASGSIICRPCANELRTTGATAQNNFVEKVKANVGRFLKGVVAL